MAKLSIVIPAYNEETHIETVVGSLVGEREEIARSAGIDKIEIVVVNDGSTDQTGERLRKFAATPDLAIVTHERNRGYGAALKTGFASASGDYLSFMDADGTISPRSFSEMYSALIRNDADMVVGTRFGQENSEMPFVRKVGNRFFAFLLSFLSGEKVRDTASGMRLFGRHVVPQLLPLPDGLHFTPAMSAKAVHERLKIVEVPIPYSEREGESKLNVVSDGVRFLRIIVGTVLLYNPFKVFFLVGLLFELAAASLLAMPLYSLLEGKKLLFSDYIYRSIGGLYFFTAGIQIILFGILARFLVSTFFKRYESGRLIHRMNDKLKVYDRMGWYGLFIFLSGIAINTLYFAQYLFEGNLNLHWAWLMIAAGLIIVGLQMIITGVVIRILRDIQEAKGLSG